MLDFNHSEIYPVQYISPDGWKGRNSATDTERLNYLWTVEPYIDNPSMYEIMPGETLTGFKLVMSEPLDIMKVLPFYIPFLGWECLYGTVVEAQE